MKTVSFNGSCPARGTLVLCTKKISHPFVVTKIHCRFPVGCVNLLKLRFYISPDDGTPSSGAPNGISMLREYGQVDYVVGDGDSKDLLHDVAVEEAVSWLKVYADNEDYSPHQVDVQITLDPKERKA